MSRSTPEWIGKSDDSIAPPRVRDRIFERAGRRCYLCSNEIKAIEGFDLDHIQALVNGGANTESNLAPVHRHCHRAKSVLDVKEKAKVARTRQKHVGIKTRPVIKIRSAPFPISERTAARQPKAQLPRRSLYAPAQEERS